MSDDKTEPPPPRIVVLDMKEESTRELFARAHRRLEVELADLAITREPLEQLAAKISEARLRNVPLPLPLKIDVPPLLAKSVPNRRRSKRGQRRRWR